MGKLPHFCSFYQLGEYAREETLHINCIGFFANINFPFFLSNGLKNFSGADYAVISASGVNVAGGSGVTPNNFVPSGLNFIA